MSRARQRSFASSLEYKLSYRRLLHAHAYVSSSWGPSLLDVILQTPRDGFSAWHRDDRPWLFDRRRWMALDHVDATGARPKQEPHSLPDAYISKKPKRKATTQLRLRLLPLFFEADYVHPPEPNIPSKALAPNHNQTHRITWRRTFEGLGLLEHLGTGVGVS